MQHEQVLQPLHITAHISTWEPSNEQPFEAWHGAYCRHHAAKRQAECGWRTSSGQPWRHWDSLATALHHPSGQRDNQHAHPCPPVPQEGRRQVSRGEPTAAHKAVPRRFAVVQRVFMQNTPSMCCAADTIAAKAVAGNCHVQLAGRNKRN